ncbi:hypothetical protein [Faecalibacter bovis]|uniref:Uncharacterized protein n=1 Tax=Faecalibacter bovis TaxID=2898187 RepID=A0ABX7XC40_9FLAO|nr:hypothetical protein [Faecalibacter bovis]MBS7333353.1 hypothetical protein [Weeksellaceae bacterium]QTV05437.1 hypothetical protein J9309_11780 [Faecalibacter bovis]
MKTLLNILGNNSKTKGTKLGLLATAATTGVTVARFLGKRSIYGIVGGVAVSLAADYIKKKYDKKLEANSNHQNPDVIEHK